MSESESMLPLLAIGGLAIGAVVLLPGMMKSKEDDSIDYERALEMARKLRQSDRQREELGMYPPDRDRIPLLIGGKQDEDAYIITDEDFSKLDIGKKDKRWLNKQRKVKDARLERVVYGDSMSLPPPPMMQSFFTNTVSPYGQGPARELTRLNHPIDLSRTNTKTNTVNLY